MSETIKVDEEVKDRLDSLKEGDTITKYGSLSYNDVLQYLLDVHDGDAEQVTESTTESTDSGGSEEGDEVGVNKTDAGPTAQDKIEAVRVEEDTETMELVPGGEDNEESEE